MQTPSEISAQARRELRRAQFAATIGCGLEFYDFISFAYFALQIGQAFFPSHDRYLSLMGSLAAFFAGFVGRPVGALVLGGFADRAGRRPAMLISLSLMGAAIVVLALTPSYAMIGVAAPIIAVVCRLVQGFALGGEVGSSTVYLVESGAQTRRGFNAGLQGVCQNVASSSGAAVGLILSTLLSEAALAAWGWRVALLLGAAIVPLALWLRARIPETLSAVPAPETPVPLTEAAAPGPTPWRAIVLGAILLGTGTIATYIFNYMATFGQTQLHLSVQTSMAGEFANSAVAILAILIGGLATDHFGRRPLMVWPQIAFILAIVPVFAWLVADRTLFVFIAANLILGGLANISLGAQLAWIAESLDPKVRTRTFALIYAVPIALLGGTTQPFITWLLHTTGTPMSAPWYLTAVSLIGLAAILYMPETAPRRAIAQA